MKRRHLVCYDYGQGALWAYVNAESPEEIEGKFHDVRVVSTPPEWLTREEQAKLETYDADRAKGWLAKLAKEPGD